MCLNFIGKINYFETTFPFIYCDVKILNLKISHHFQQIFEPNRIWDLTLHFQEGFDDLNLNSREIRLFQNSLDYSRVRSISGDIQ